MVCIILKLQANAEMKIRKIKLEDSRKEAEEW